jgi:hypothetical protein
MNGLAQYGVSHGSLVGTIVVDIPTNVPDPTGLTRAAVQNKLVSWIRNGQVFPAPAVDEQNLVYLIFLPTNSTFTDIGVGYHNFGKYNRVSSDNDLFWGVILTNYPPRTSAGAFVNALTYIVSHELCEAFSDRDGKGFTTANTSCTFSGPPITRITNACEIGDVCESRGTNTCCYTYSYHVTNRTWQVEQYWSNWDNQCINGDQPVSLRQFLQAIGVDGSTGLRQLQSNVINVDFVASKM